MRRACVALWLCGCGGGDAASVDAAAPDAVADGGAADAGLVPPDAGAADAEVRAGTWFVNIGGDGTNRATDIAVTSSGDVYAVGRFAGTTTILGATGTSQGDADGFLVARGPTGTPRWFKTYGGAGTDVAESVAVDTAGRVHVTGQISGTSPIDFGGMSATGAGNEDIFVATWDADGTLVRVTAF